MKLRNLVETAVIILLLVVVFSPVYGPMVYRFTARESYYSHGFIIPLVVLYLVFRKRKTLANIPAQPHWSGLVFMLGGLFMHMAGAVLKINVISYFAIPMVIMGIVLYLKGKRFAKELLFPIGFLIFMLPLPEVLIIGVTFKMKIMAAQWSTVLANIMGIEATRSGSIIYFPGGHMLVGDPCSGLRSLITFLALGALFTQFTSSALWKKQVLFLAAIPVALLSNLIRLTFSIFVGYVYGEKILHGFVHDVSGYMVFILGFLGMLMAAKLLRCQLSI